MSGRRLDPREVRYVEEARRDGREALKQIADRKFGGIDPRELSQSLERTERARVRETGAKERGPH